MRALRALARRVARLEGRRGSRDAIQLLRAYLDGGDAPGVERPVARPGEPRPFLARRPEAPRGSLEGRAGGEEVRS